MLLLNLSPRKRCTGCGQMVVVGQFVRHAGRRDGLTDRCNGCRRTERHDHYERNRATIRAKLNAVRAADPEKAKDQFRAWYERNADSVMARNRAWHAAHPGHAQAYNAAYYAEHGETLRPMNAARQRTRYATDPEYRSRRLREAAEWQRAHLALHSQRQRLRACRIQGRTVDILGESALDARASVFGHRCAYCAGPFESWDHVKPLHRGGMHCLANLRPACRRCNSRKGALPPFVWLQRIQQESHARDSLQSWGFT